MRFNQQKTALLSGFFVSHCLFCSRAPQLIGSIQRLRTTIIVDTQITLAVIPFKVEANNSCHYKHTRKLCRISVPLQSIIPCLTKVNFALLSMFPSPFVTTLYILRYARSSSQLLLSLYLLCALLKFYFLNKLSVFLLQDKQLCR